MGKLLKHQKILLRKKWLEEKRQKRLCKLRQGKISSGEFRFKRRWLLRKAKVPPERLAAAEASDSEMKNLKGLLAQSVKRRRSQLRRALRAKFMPGLYAELKQIIKAAKPDMDKVIKWDQKIRRQLERIELNELWCRTIRPMSAHQIIHRMRIRRKQIELIEARKALAKEKQMINRLRGGNWGKYRRRKINPT